MEAVLPPLQRFLLFSGVLILVGAVAWRSFVGPWQPPPLRPAMRRVEIRVARTGFWVSLLLICVWGIRLQVQVMEFRDPFAPLRDDVLFLLRETFWGTVWLAQGGLLMALAAGFRHLTRRARAKELRERPWVAAEWDPKTGVGPGETLPKGWKGVWVGVILLVLTLSLSSHAMSVPLVAPLAVAMDAAHTLAAGAWMGTLSLIIGLQARRHEPPHVLAGQLKAFSYLAWAAVPLLLVMGVMLSGFHLGELRNLWASDYGRVLSLKIFTAVGVMLMGFRNWRYGLPAVNEERGARSVRRWAAAEVALAACVLLVTAILVGMPMPEGVH